MNILAVIESFFPGRNGGGPVSALHNLSAQLPPDIRLFILTRNRDYLQSEPYASVVADEWIAEGQYRICYASDAAWWSIYRQAIREWQPDWVYLNGLFAPLTRQILRDQSQTARIILAPHGNLGPGALRKAKLKKACWLWLARKRGVFKQIRWHAASPREAAQIRRHIDKDADIVVVPMAPAPLPMTPEAHRVGDPEEKRTLRLVYFGRLSREKNLGFAFDCLKALATRRPDLRIIYDLYCIGAACPHLEARSGDMPSRVEVNFHQGLDQEDLRDRLSCGNYHAMLMPSWTENFSYTTFESMQAGIPPVISDQTPWRELEAQGLGWDLSLETPEAWLTALQALVDQSPAETAQRRKKLLQFAERWVADYPEQLKQLFADERRAGG